MPQELRRLDASPGFIAFHLLLPLALTALGKFNNRAIAWLTTIMSFKDSRAC